MTSSEQAAVSAPSFIQLQIPDRVLRALEAYGPKASLQGLYHIYLSQDIRRRVYWTIILLLAVAFAVFHTVESAKRYHRGQAFYHISDEATKAVFPAITVCNLKPFSETILVYYPDIVNKYFAEKWNYFEKWFLQARVQAPNESDLAFKTRLKALFSKFMEVIWVSDDTRDLGMADNIALTSCMYEGKPCDRHNFTMVRDPEGWNCYSFVSDGSSPVGSLGLTLVLFTDGAFFHPLEQHTDINQLNISVQEAIENANTLATFNSLRELLLRSSNRSLNQVAARSAYQSNGVRVIIHDPGSHPWTSDNRLEFQSGVASLVTINQMMVARLNRPGKSECSSEPFETVRYVKDFDSEGYISYQGCHKLLREHVIEEKQNLVFSRCRCYSHRYPFWTTTDTLCYYAPKSQRREPSIELMDRITCHNAAVLEADNMTDDLLRKHKDKMPCQSVQNSFITNVYNWPLNIRVRKNAIDVLKSFFNGSEVSAGVGQHVHRIFNFTDGDIVKMLGNRTVNRQEATLKLLFKCSPNPSPFQFCLSSNELLKQNLLKLTIRHWRRDSRMAREKYSFDWPEMLSELGGISGLWLGMSALTLFDIVEVVYYMIKRPSSQTKRRTVEESAFQTAPLELPCGGEDEVSEFAVQSSDSDTVC